MLLLTLVAIEKCALISTCKPMRAAILIQTIVLLTSESMNAYGLTWTIPPHRLWCQLLEPFNFERTDRHTETHTVTDATDFHPTHPIHASATASTGD